MSVSSPVTGNKNTNLIQKIPVKTIIEKYQRIDLDVSRFFQNMQDIEMYQCNDTQYRFYYPYTIFGDDKFYEELQLKESGYYYQGRWEHFQAIDLIKSNETVLEIGCGDGFFLNLLRTKNIKSVGLELNPKAATEARKKGLEVFTQLLEEHAPKNENAYDIVCSFQVLEHISNPRSYFLNSLKVVKPGGRLIIAVPNNNPYIFKHDILHTLNLPPHHSGLWNRESFENIPKFFPIALSSINIEPLSEYKEWFQVQLKYLRGKRSFWGSLLSIVPRPFYKFALRLFRNSIEGRNIIAVFTKPDNNNES